MTIRVSYSSELHDRDPEIRYALAHLFRVAGIEGVRRPAGESSCHVHYGPNRPEPAVPTLWIRPSRFFTDDYGSAGSIPAEPSARIDDTPILYTAPDGPGGLAAFPGGLVTGADLVASAFVLLSGYEEQINGQRDMHDRFIARFSVIAGAGFSSAPLADRYADILRKAISELIGVPVTQPSWDGQGFALALTHDVDSLRCPRWAAPGASGAKPKRTPTPLLPVHTLESAYGVRSTIFFLVRSHPQDKHPYDFESAEAQEACRGAAAHGAELGLHGSYDCFYADSGPADEMAVMRRRFASVAGFRQHYLRLPADSLQLLEEAHVAYDMSLGWPDRPGFRNGTAWPFQPFSFVRRAPLSLLEIPLAVMDRTLEKYCALDAASAERLALDILRETERSGGCASVLWHHEFFDETKHPGFAGVYERIVAWLRERRGRALTGGEICARFHATAESGAGALSGIGSK